MANTVNSLIYKAFQEAISKSDNPEQCNHADEAIELYCIKCQRAVCKKCFNLCKSDEVLSMLDQTWDSYIQEQADCVNKTLELMNTNYQDCLQEISVIEERFTQDTNEIQQNIRENQQDPLQKIQNLEKKIQSMQEKQQQMESHYQKLDKENDSIREQMLQFQNRINYIINELNKREFSEVAQLDRYLKILKALQQFKKDYSNNEYDLSIFDIPGQDNIIQKSNCDQSIIPESIYTSEYQASMDESSEANIQDPSKFAFSACNSDFQPNYLSEEPSNNTFNISNPL